VLDLVNIFASNIAPILIIAGLGYLVGRALQLESRSLAKLIFNLFSPALVFYSLYVSTIDGREFGTLLLLIVLFQFLMAALSYLILRFQHPNRVERVAVMLGAFSLNTGSYGLSVVSFAFGAEVLARAVAVYIGNTILNYTFGVFVASSGSLPPAQALRNILRVPAFYATIVALLLRGLNITLPDGLFRSVEVLKDAAIPAMLVLLGLQLSQPIVISRRRLVSTGILIKFLLSPVIGVGLVLLFHLDNLAAAAFIMQTSMPTAVMTLILAKEYRLDETLMINLIMISTLLSPLTLSVIILILKKVYFAQ
jgi:predicted permease